MSRKERNDDIGYDSMEEFLDENGDTPALAGKTLAEEWDNADPEDHLPTIPGTAMLDTVRGDAFLWDDTCNKGLKFDGDLMAREDYKAVKRND